MTRECSIQKLDVLARLNPLVGNVQSDTTAKLAKTTRSRVTLASSAASPVLLRQTAFALKDTFVSRERRKLSQKAANVQLAGSA
jgi:hypothetical protein